jgi:hypothetical protein
MEGSGLLHDLLPGGAADAQSQPARGGGHRRRVALVFLPPGAVATADADDIVRPDQRGDQRLPHGGPRVRADGYASAITVVLVVVLASVALFQFFVLDKRVHYK